MCLDVLCSRAVLENAGNALLLVDLGLVLEREGGLGQGRLQLLSGGPRVGQQVRVGLDDGPAAGAEAFLFLSRRATLDAAGCGQQTVHGELLLAPSNAPFVLPPWDGANPSELTLAVPNSVALVDATFYLQGLFGIPGRTRTYRFTNALEFQLGPQ